MTKFLDFELISLSHRLNIHLQIIVRKLLSLKKNVRVTPKKMYSYH